MIPTNLRKHHLTPASTDDGLSVQDVTPERATKRIRGGRTATALSSGDFPITNFQNFPSSSHFVTPFDTPPPSARVPQKPTLSLKLNIPEHVPSEKEKHQLAARKGAATRWANQGKLHRPMPENKEIRAAYNLKLMRHYPAPTPPASSTSSSTSAPATASPTPAPEDNFIRPVIQKSARVANLLKSFPAVNVASAVAVAERDNARAKLRQNEKNTASDEARKLAWRNFSKEDKSTRQVMLESALPEVELIKETRGQANDLPDWIKYRTSKYAREQAELTNKQKRKK
jgi:hypothetical protein